jgi:hypothetical protein
MAELRSFRLGFCRMTLPRWAMRRRGDVLRFALLSALVTAVAVGTSVRAVLGDAREPETKIGQRVDFSASDLSAPPDKLRIVPFSGNRAAKARVAEQGGRRVLSIDPTDDGDVIYYNAPQPAVEETYSFIYSGPDSIVEPLFVNERRSDRGSIEGFTTDLSASGPGYDYAGSVSYRSIGAGGKVENIRRGRLRTEPYFYQNGHTYRVDAIADAVSKVLTTRVYDVDFGPQAFDVGIKVLGVGAELSPGMLAQHGHADVLDFAFGLPGRLPVRPHRARRAGDYMNYLGYNAWMNGPATSKVSLAFQRSFPQLLIKHVRIPDVMSYLPSLNAVARYGIDADVLTGNKTTLDSLRRFIAALALPPDSIELWNEPNNPKMGASYDPDYQADLPGFAAQIAKAYPNARIWGPSLLPNHGYPRDVAELSQSVGPYISAWNAHSYTLGAPENVGYGGFFSHACGKSRSEDCGYAGAASFSDNVSAVLNPALPGVTTEGAASYGSHPEICGHTNVDPATQQAYVERGMLYNFKLGHLRIYPYKFIDDAGCSDGFGTYGIMSYLVQADGQPLITPKPAYTSLVYLDHILADPGVNAKSIDPKPLEYALEGASPDVEELLLGESDGSYRLVLWSDKALWDFNANGEAAAGSEKPLVNEPVNVKFGERVKAMAYVQTPGNGAWAASTASEADRSSIRVVINQYPLVVSIARENGSAQPVVLPRDVPTPGPTETPHPR